MKVYILRVKTIFGSSKRGSSKIYTRDVGIYLDQKLLEEDLLEVVSICNEKQNFFLGWSVVEHQVNEISSKKMFIYIFPTPTDNIIQLISSKKDVQFGAVKPDIYKVKINSYFASYYLVHS